MTPQAPDMPVHSTVNSLETAMEAVQITDKGPHDTDETLQDFNAPPQTFDKFTKFPDLPIELRLAIWSFVPETRIVEVEFSKEKKTWFAPIESACQPVLLSVCGESRKVMLEGWLPLLPHFSSDPSRQSRMASKIARGFPYSISYFNPKLDTLYIDDSVRSILPEKCLKKLGQLVKLPALKNLRHLACSESLLPYSFHAQERTDEILEIMLKFKHLRRFSYIIGDPWLSLDHESWKKMCKGVIEFRHTGFRPGLDPVRFKSPLEKYKKQSVLVDEKEIWRGDKDMWKESLRMIERRIRGLRPSGEHWAQ
ncbi:uncharacterized protein LY89DRAFT_678086 [Mollisia scopiformis]|uniref:2EXR domain-containing protein n=1 Tax=Mollisia scopiformis TaxID=149040 RepID=A0A132B3Y0_MOLSC|nr:uncharacterized protein LY89DRAFT_678086 [Mollisia scopiformis]KUJ07118.1 hypothetical protein LY89DRAFT_678086 [Mollisia scopiformis]